MKVRKKKGNNSSIKGKGGNWRKIKGRKRKQRGSYRG